MITNALPKTITFLSILLLGMLFWQSAHAQQFDPDRPPSVFNDPTVTAPDVNNFPNTNPSQVLDPFADRFSEFDPSRPVSVFNDPNNPIVDTTGSVVGGLGDVNSSQSNSSDTSSDPVDDDDWQTKIKKFIYNAFVSAGGMVAWVGGNMLDWAIQKLVIEFGKLLTENLGVAVDSIWLTVRDTINIAFIFILIWIGLRTIFEAEDSKLKQQLPLLIAAALLINFSLFFAKAVVDFSNIAATQIAQGFIVREVGPGNAFEVQTSNLGSEDGSILPTNVTDSLAPGDLNISSAFMESTRLSSFAGNLVVAERGLGFVFAFSLLVFFMMVIAGFVFLAGAILLIIRFVVLTIAMMFSPLMFLGWVYPGLKWVSDKWMSIFLKNAFVAPAYLFMLYIALAVLAPSGSGGFGFVNGAIADAVDTDGGDVSFGIFLYFGIVIGFLIAAVKVAEMMSTHGANAVNTVGMAGANWARGVATSPLRYGKNLGRNVGGAAASVAYRNLPFVGGNASRQSAKNLEASLQRKREGTATGWDKARIAYQGTRGAGSTSDRLETLKASAGRKIGGGLSANQVASEAAAGNKAKAAKAAADKIQTADTAGNLSNLRKASKTQIESLYNDKSKGVAFLKKEANAIYFTEKQFDAIDELVNEGTITEQDKNDIKEAHENALKELSENRSVGTVTPDLYFGNLSSDDIAKLEGDILVEMAKHNLLQVSDLDAILRSGRRNARRDQIRNEITASPAAATPGPVKQAAEWLNGGRPVGVTGGTGPGINF